MPLCSQNRFINKFKNKNKIIKKKKKEKKDDAMNATKFTK